MHTFFQRPAFSTGSKSHGVFAKTLLCAALTCAAAAFQSAVAAEVTDESIRALGPGRAALEATDGQTLTLTGTTHQVAGSVNFMSMAMTKSSATAQNFIDPDTIKEKAEAYVSPRGTKGPMELYDDYYRFTGENREAALNWMQNEVLKTTRENINASFGAGSRITMTLDGEQSYWYGDEQGGRNNDAFAKVAYDDGSSWFIKKNMGPAMGILLQEGFNVHALDGANHDGGELDLTLRNGAQWSYLGRAESYETTQSLVISNSLLGGVVDTAEGDLQVKVFAHSIPKRISAIRLEEGGIVNLDDADLAARFKAIGLDAPVDHNYVRIGDLRGDGGIFRLNLNAQDKTRSDMIFVENASEASTDKPSVFYIEADNPAALATLPTDETLRFATVSAAAAGKIRFEDRVNVQGAALKDYRLYIRREAYDAASPENALYEERVYEDEKAFADLGASATFDTQYNATVPDKPLAEGERHTYSFNAAEDFKGGENWVIYRIEATENSENTARLQLNTLAGWQYARTLDRLHYRLGEIRYSNESRTGLWARARYDRLDRSRFNLDRSMVQIGADVINTGHNRLGLAAEYSRGASDFDHRTGESDLTGYSLMFYDTWLSENGAWLDFTASAGRMSTDASTALTTGERVSASYGERLYKVGLEAGHRFDFVTPRVTFFAEPQLQVQYTRLESTDFKMSNGFGGQISRANSVITRAGVRLGEEGKTAAGLNSVYVVADVLHESGGGQQSRYYNGAEVAEERAPGHETWFDIGVSGTLHLTEGSLLHLDVLKYCGSGYRNAWMAGVNLRYAF